MTTATDQKSGFAAPSWVPVRANSVAYQIVLQVRDALFSGDLKPGHPIGSEKALAESFGVSRITVRDALRTLETMGIVEIRVGAAGGARIAEGNIDRFADALAIQLKLAGISAHEMIGAQIAVEGAAAEMAAADRTAADLKKLRALLEKAAGLLDDPAGFTQSGQRFHLAVAEASGNRALVAQFKALRHIVWPRHAVRTNREIAERVLRTHAQLYEMIENSDGQGARELMCAHLESIRTVAFSGAGDSSSEPVIYC